MFKKVGYQLFKQLNKDKLWQLFGNKSNIILAGKQIAMKAWTGCLN